MTSPRESSILIYRREERVLRDFSERSFSTVTIDQTKASESQFGFNRKSPRCVALFNLHRLTLLRLFSRSRLRRWSDFQATDRILATSTGLSRAPRFLSNAPLCIIPAERTRTREFSNYRAKVRSARARCPFGLRAANGRERAGAAERE